MTEQVSVENVDARGDVLNQPVKTLEQSFAGVGAAADDLPMPAFVHDFKIENLKSTKTSSVILALQC